MQDFLNKLKHFMDDRYGVDDLSCALGALGVIIALLGALLKVGLFTWIAIIVIVLAIVRAISRISPPASVRMISSASSPPRRLPSTASLTSCRSSMEPSAWRAPAAPPRRCSSTARPRCTSAARTVARFSLSRAVKAAFSSPAASAAAKQKSVPNHHERPAISLSSPC